MTTVTNASVVFKDKNGNVGTVKGASANDVTKIRNAISDVAQVVDPTSHLPINATTSSVGVVQLADSAAVAAGTAGRVVDAAQLKDAIDNIDISNMMTTDTAQTVTAVKTFSALPQSSVVPTTDNQLVNKKYVDDHATPAPTNMMTTDTAQTVTAVKTFSTLPESSVVPTSANQLVNKAYVDDHSSGGGSGSLDLFDVVPKDHVLTYGKDLEGFALLGSWVYKTAVDGSRYGYPTFVAKCLAEYAVATPDTITFDNITLDIKRHPNGHIYFDVADAAKVNTYYNNYGHAWFYGIDETNERVFLPRQAHGKLIESYKNGSDWYRIYEDGFCEQGGSFYISATTGTVSLLKSFIDTTYIVGTFWNGNNYFYQQGFTKNVNSFTWVANTSGFTVDWQASGYISLANVEVTPSYEYMVVGNTTVEQASTEVIDVTTTNNDTVPLFTAYYFDYTPNNLSWLKGGSQSNSGDLYKTCYNELVNVLNGETKYGALKVIDESDMVSGTDYSLYWIVDQTTETFRTPTKTQQRFVVKTYKNGSDWYRIYNDGWCEQGGYIVTNSNTLITVSLLKAYAATSYTLLLTAQSRVNSGTISGYGPVRIMPYNKTSSSFQWQGGSTSEVINAMSWQASGYIDLTNETFDTSLYFKVANAVENIELLDVGEVTEALTSKADVTLENASNVAQSFKNMSVRWVMPDYSSAITITTPYTAPCDGYVLLTQFVRGGYISSYINGTIFKTVGGEYNCDDSVLYLVSKGDVISWEGSYYGVACSFIPCKGVSNA